MSYTRREFLRTSSAAAITAGVAAFPRPLLAQLGGATAELVPRVEDPRIRLLAARALDAARAAGASYADVRLGHAWTRSFTAQGVGDMEFLTVGVRVLVDGYWGFASSPVWSPDEMVRLAAEAVHQAKVNALGQTRTVDLAPAPIVQNGHWTMPVKIDPFDVPIFEVIDELRGLELFLARTPGAMSGANGCEFVRHETAFSSTVGSYCTQRTYRTGGAFSFQLSTPDGKQGQGSLEILTPAGVGWELYKDQPIRDQITRAIEELRADLALPINPVEVGRYDTAFDARSVANFIAETLARATELDRAMGYESNAEGTSYINDPLTMIGSYQAGAPTLNLTGNRTEPGGCATVKWDDEGIAPDDFAIVKDGTLVDFQTTRESAGWLKEYYRRSGKSIHSHGCAASPSPIFAPMQRIPNVTLEPGHDARDFESLVSALDHGLAVRDVNLSMDFQNLSGLATGRIYEIKKGKRVAIVGAGGLLFRSPELWKGMSALGGQGSARRFGFSATKSEPEQVHFASVTAVPATFKQLTLIDALRKA